MKLYMESHLNQHQQPGFLAIIAVIQPILKTPFM